MANPVREGYQEFNNEEEAAPRPNNGNNNNRTAPLVEETNLFHDRIASSNTLTSEQAFIHMVKVGLILWKR